MDRLFGRWRLTDSAEGRRNNPSWDVMLLVKPVARLRLAAPLLKLSTRLLTTGRWSQASEFRVGKKGFKKSQICLKGKSILFYFLVFNVKFDQYPLHM